MTNPQRDAQLEQWLRGSSNSATAETPDCLDFEALAALVDNGLGRTERERALLHVAGCARCQGFARGARPDLRRPGHGCH